MLFSRNLSGVCHGSQSSTNSEFHHHEDKTTHIHGPQTSHHTSFPPTIIIPLPCRCKRRDVTWMLTRRMRMMMATTLTTMKMLMPPGLRLLKILNLKMIDAGNPYVARRLELSEWCLMIPFSLMNATMRITHHPWNPTLPSTTARWSDVIEHDLKSLAMFLIPLPGWVLFIHTSHTHHITSVLNLA